MGMMVPLARADDVLDIKGESAILMDAETGQILYEKNADKPLPPASMTKLMTIVLAMEALQEGRVTLNEKVIASENAWKLGGSQIWLEPGETMTFNDMLVAIAVGSANECCVAVAEHLEGSHEAFVERMNLKAKELGMKKTHFVNAYGLHDDNHYTNSRDMSTLGRYALTFPDILKLTTIKEYSLRGGEFILYNTNKLLWWYEGADGFKTGWTNQAKYCLVSTVKRNGLRLVGVIMASPEARGNFRDSMTMYNYGFARYAYKSLANQNTMCGLAKVGKGLTDVVEVGPLQEIGSIIPKGKEASVTWGCSVVPYIDAPVKKGDRLGEARVMVDGKVVLKVPLLAMQHVPRGSVWQTVVKTWNKIFLVSSK
ncbi:MAG: D-alanyl-D-alanine carboxypeptidase [Syntrophomonadaceae bacterium]|nr:D-alanyl-D-alanine carboxypeptidase [Syntrophomonadaceae bacterium]